MKCLEKDRTRRYATANGLASDIKRHLRQQAGNSPRPRSVVYEFQKTVRRHKAAFAAGALIILVLATSVLVSTREANYARAAEREQIHLRNEAVLTAQNARRESYGRAMLLGCEALRARDYGLVRGLQSDSCVSRRRRRRRNN